jgi:hypothetical protein
LYLLRFSVCQVRFSSKEIFCKEVKFLAQGADKSLGEGKSDCVVSHSKAINLMKDFVVEFFWYCTDVHRWKGETSVERRRDLHRQSCSFSVWGYNHS